MCEDGTATCHWVSHHSALLLPARFCFQALAGRPSLRGAPGAPGDAPTVTNPQQRGLLATWWKVENWVSSQSTGLGPSPTPWAQEKKRFTQDAATWRKGRRAQIYLKAFSCQSLPGALHCSQLLCNKIYSNSVAQTSVHIYYLSCLHKVSIWQRLSWLFLAPGF